MFGEKLRILAKRSSRVPEHIIMNLGDGNGISSLTFRITNDELEVLAQLLLQLAREETDETDYELG